MNSIVGKLQQAENDKLVAKQKAEQARLIRTVAYIFTVINSWRSDSALLILIFYNYTSSLMFLAHLKISTSPIYLIHC